jgi:hypothetical protein
VSEVGRSSSTVGFRGAGAGEGGLRLLGAGRETERGNEDKGPVAAVNQRSSCFLLLIVLPALSPSFAPLSHLLDVQGAHAPHWSFSWTL